MPSYTFTENTTSQNSSDTPTTGVTSGDGIVEAEPTSRSSSLGQDPEVSRFGGSDHQNWVLWFDTSSIPDSETVTAVTLYCYHNSNNGESHTINVYEVLQTSVTSSLTWNTYDGSNSWNTAGCRGSGTDRSSSTIGSTTISSTSGEYKSFSLSTSVVDVAGSTYVILEMDSGDGESGDFTVWEPQGGTDGQRPELVVTTSTGVSFTPRLTLLGVG